MPAAVCGRCRHWLPPSERCQRCRVVNNTRVPVETVERFRAMWLDGSWLPYTSLVMDELIEGMAVVLVRREQDE